MEEILDSKYRRKIFYASSIIAFIALISVRFFVLPYISGQLLSPQAIIGSVIDNLTAALVASLAVTSLIIWLTPPVMKTAVVEVVEPFRIREVLEDALEKTSEWWYMGHLGRHFRSVTLRQLAANAKDENVTKTIFILTLNPTRPETCEYYSLYRQRLRSAHKDKIWTPERVRLELNTTIISAYAWKIQEPALDINFALIDTVSLFRIDLSSRLALITKEDPREPALRYDRGTHFYNSFLEDLRMSLQQARELPKNVKGIPFAQMNTANVKNLLIKLGLDNQDLSDATLNEIISLAQKAENPYV